MNKKLFVFCSLLLCCLAGCNNDTKLTFSAHEYSIHSGDAVTIEQNYHNVNYEIIGQNDVTSINVDASTGVFTFDDTIPNAKQVLYVAKYKSMTSEPVVVTLLHDYEVADVTFDNLSNYVVDGEFVTATASLPYAMTYSLKERVPGISINSSSGKVSFTNIVQDNTPFVVVASTHNGAKSEKEFYTLTKNFIEVENNRQVVERNSGMMATFVLDFSQSEEAKDNGVLALSNEQNLIIDAANYTYNRDTMTLKIKSDYLNTLYDGVNSLKIITSRNAISIDVEVATKFIYTAHDLAAINNSVEALSGYYILMNDIDLSSYLSKEGEGYNDGKGWTAIGGYEDVIDPNIATMYAFKGTFDGNGYTIYNMQSTRKDVRSFNAGLFGYVTNSAIIKNLGVTGTLDVSSYSGGFVGSNSGTITNCWADVDVSVYSGDNVYRYVGGFAGNNFGTIENCYAVGSVNCDDYFGAFVGSDNGEIINCYALESSKCHSFVGFGKKNETCILFSSEYAMKSFAWENVFPNDKWYFEPNSYPILKNTIRYYEIHQIAFSKSILDKNYYHGDRIALEAHVYPQELESKYIDKITYSITKNGGAKIEDKTLNTLNARDSNIEVFARLEIEDGTTYEDKITIHLGTKITSLVLNVDYEYMKAGHSYPLNATYEPYNATENINYYLKGTNLDGISVDGNIITLSEDCNIEEFIIYAVSQDSSIVSNEVQIKVNPLQRIANVVAYTNGKETFDLIFNEEVNLSNAKVMCNEKNIAYSVDNNTLLINKKEVINLQDTLIKFEIETSDGKRYLSNAIYYSHEIYDESYVRKHYNNVIEIDSKEDFYQYFNMNSSSYLESKTSNYDKVFMLTKDIDFNQDIITSIGFSNDENDCSFKGKLFGCGHTISNFIMSKNERSLILDEESSNYGVGLFGSLNGEIYDLTLRDIKVTAKNFVGGLVGVMKGGYVENCQVLNNDYRDILAGEHSQSTKDVHVAGIVGRCFEGNIFGCYYNEKDSRIVG